MRLLRGVVAILVLMLLSGVSFSRAHCQQFKLGDYVATTPQGQVTLTFADSGKMTAVFGTIAIQSSFKVVGDTIVIVNLAGPGACPSAHVGRYRWALQADTLGLTAISDPCSGRAAGLTFNAWIAKRP